VFATLLAIAPLLLMVIPLNDLLGELIKYIFDNINSTLYR
jgi:hypothetical protein